MKTAFRFSALAAVFIPAFVIVGLLHEGGPSMAAEERGVAAPADEFPSDPDAGALATLKERYAGNPAGWPAARILQDAQVRELAPLPLPPRPMGADLAKAELGRSLFEDPRLSQSGQIACQSCHNRELGWGDGLRTSFGHDRQKGKRNAQPLFNASFRSQLFWDGRAGTLQEQAMGPLFDPAEMANHDADAVVERLRRDDGYRKRFTDVFGPGEITIARMTDALAAFERILEQPTALDRFLSGNKSALSEEQVWGMHLFRTKAGCMNCHSGPLLTDDRFHNLGLSLLGRPLEDTGRYGVTGLNDDVGRFRTPSLRHVGETAPYMHNGLIRNLRLVLRFYEVGGGRTLPRNEKEAENPLMPFAGQTSSLAEKFQLTDRERQALLSFLEAI